jgi:glycosyltransferase involved in cell wall biosynthesis
MRVMIVTNSLTGGGAERSMNLVCNELIRRGWPVSLVAINSSEPDLIAPTGEIFLLNRKWPGNIVGTFSSFYKFIRVVFTWKPDVVILNCDLPELFGALLPRRQRLVVVEHSNPAWTTRLAFGRIIRTFLRMRNVTWVAVSAHLQIWPRRTKPHYVLENPLTPSIEHFEELNTSSDFRRLVYVGRLASTQKRPEWILEIGSLTSLEVLIIGDGDARQALQAQADSKQLKIEFTGYVRDAWSLVEPGDLLVVPSAWEGDGLVVIEGMRRGIPMLISDISDFRRFDLPNKNYCQNVEDFVKRINEYRNSLDLLVVPKDKKDLILTSRSLDAVGDAWESFLVSI